MSDLKDLAKNENVNLDDCIVFTKDGGDALAVNIAYVGIKQRQDKLMSVNFSMSPQKVKQLDEFFSDVNSGALFYYDISQTGSIPVNYRGLSNVTKKVSNNPDAIFEVSLLMQTAQNVPKDSYLDPTCDCCSFHCIL
ncbi:MAG: hypothetical protein IJQ68_00345 [Methanobrevibacter sp.]|uniref:hypothetical protein n=1 Tax=Methanobrevibacter sp. TaxID=66852 RepID=UPI0025CCB625|nr:hypothetical protein [Methanobrevibacter sp.]MBR0270435.1 hypothetical protein [Methanobrevibacter sp.]